MMERSAVMSEDGIYRYRWTSRWAGGPSACWIMLNPSTADATKDDPTTKRVVSFTRSWNLGAAVVVNLFAYRATEPDVLLDMSIADVIGPENRDHLRREIALADTVIAAWGAHPAVWTRRAPDVGRFAWELNKSLRCLGMTKSGAPRHPLYVKGDTERCIFPTMVKGAE